MSNYSLPEHIIPTGLQLLPDKYDSAEARTMLYAIGIQESNFEYRLQIRGPARGFWQFERAGVSGVVRHTSSRAEAAEVCGKLKIDFDVGHIHEAIAYNDTLAVCFARLLLWTLPKRLPRLDDPAEAWRQYLDAWRPGRPRQEHWAANFEAARNSVSV